MTGGQSLYGEVQVEHVLGQGWECGLGCSWGQSPRDLCLTNGIMGNGHIEPPPSGQNNTRL